MGKTNENLFSYEITILNDILNRFIHLVSIKYLILRGRGRKIFVCWDRLDYTPIEIDEHVH